MTFAWCDLTHFYGELMKFGDYKNWEQYIEIAFRSGGVCIEDMWVELEVYRVGRESYDGYAAGAAVGHLLSLFLDTMF